MIHSFLHLLHPQAFASKTKGEDQETDKQKLLQDLWGGFDHEGSEMRKHVGWRMKQVDCFLVAQEEAGVELEEDRNGSPNLFDE